MKQRAKTRKGMLVTTVALDRGLHKRLVMAAIENNASMTELVRRAVREWLDRRPRRS